MINTTQQIKVFIDRLYHEQTYITNHEPMARILNKKKTSEYLKSFPNFLVYL